MVVAMGTHGLAEHTSMASEALNPRGETQAAWLFKSSSQRFEERASRLLDGLTRIRAEVHAEDGGEFYRTMENLMAASIRNASSEVVVELYRLKAKSMADDAGEKRLFFYQYNIVPHADNVGATQDENGAAANVALRTGWEVEHPWCRRARDTV